MTRSNPIYMGDSAAHHTVVAAVRLVSDATGVASAEVWRVAEARGAKAFAEAEIKAEKARRKKGIYVPVSLGEWELIAPGDLTEKRKESVQLAIEAGADVPTLHLIVGADRLARKGSITLPAPKMGRKRGKGWARQDLETGGVRWGLHAQDGLEVREPGLWLVMDSDGFKETRTRWDVQNVSVGPETWTLANKV
jgi:hypothetical protein